MHRTGHSIGQEIHGAGANMDNFETHDERRIIPGLCFSIEPGIYLEDFGVRSEIDMFVDEASASVTGEMQDALVLVDFMRLAERGMPVGSELTRIPRVRLPYDARFKQ